MFLQPAQIKIVAKIISHLIPRNERENVTTMLEYWSWTVQGKHMQLVTIILFLFLHLMILLYHLQVENPELPKIEIEIPSQLKLKLEDDCYFIKRKKKVCYTGLQIISRLAPVKLSGQTYFWSDISHFWPDKHQ